MSALKHTFFFFFNILCDKLETMCKTLLSTCFYNDCLQENHMHDILSCKLKQPLLHRKNIFTWKTPRWKYCGYSNCIFSRHFLENKVNLSFVPVTLNLTASQFWKTLLMRWVVLLLKKWFKKIYNKMCQYLEDL